ncbi:MAG: methyl-accepting chemotaxis protein [Eubacterium sp.]|nr:methyl-accepting chemotaxis protein [Eubacterium sp.]MCM1304719.1 methyl-accepting chemotaxis protein [Butyrivibrio sp.]MCM1344929.1 methyl-accepting chemotaxis protein [Muribaculaceae bacterium]MCM1412077.1 methyl-accepting chemotaxis protein [Lachnospiraceae bacterium]
MKFSEKKYVNRTALLGHTIIDTVLFLAYLLEVFKGSRTIGYFAIFAVLTVAPVAVEWVIFVKKPESGAIKHIIGITYGILYLFVVFTTTSTTPFTYAFPMFFVIILYMDVRFNVLIGLFAFFGNVAFVVYHAMTVGYTAAEIPDVEIRVAATFLTVVFMVMTTVAVTRVNRHKLDQIKAQTEETERLVQNVLAVSQEMIANISEVARQMSDLGGSVSKVHDAMGEVTTGSVETAESVQVQMQRTEQIQAHIGKVRDTAAQIEMNISETAQKVTTGREQMDALAGHVEESKTANAQVLAKMEELGTYTSQMNTIIEAISSIADNTSLLALNASIEAARAGAAGKGFAVVASQIAELANQTQTATTNITGLIGNINQELEHVSEAVDVVTRSNVANVESTDVVKNNFMGISRGTEDISRRTKELLAVIEELARANGDIVENIQTISAITEEISAHANETYHVCDENSQMVDSVSRIVEELNESAQKIQQNM